MKQILDILTGIANLHLNIPTLETRNSDSLDFHDVSASSVKKALRTAYEAGASTSAASTGVLKGNLLKKMRRALQMASNYMSDDLDEADETEMRVFRAIRAALTEARRAASELNAAHSVPVLAIHVQGGLINDMNATLPVHVVIEDWDITDDDTGKRPNRSVWTLTGGLSGPKAENLRRLAANV